MRFIDGKEDMRNDLKVSHLFKYNKKKIVGTNVLRQWNARIRIRDPQGVCSAMLANTSSRQYLPDIYYKGCWNEEKEASFSRRTHNGNQHIYTHTIIKISSRTCIYGVSSGVTSFTIDVRSIKQQAICIYFPRIMKLSENFIQWPFILAKSIYC